MQTRLVHTQALLLLSAVLMAVLAMGALSAWNLRNGFSDYLATRDVERLEQFALRGFFSPLRPIDSIDAFKDRVAVR
jgi:hypothetical protein